MKSSYFWFLLFLLAILAFTLRWISLSKRSLVYDEIWSLEHYAKAESIAEIFQNLGTPNNHVLHSLALRASIQCFGISLWSIRLPALLAGLFLCLASAFLAQLLFQNRWKTLAVFTLTCFWDSLFYYSTLARGYTLQNTLIVAFALSIVWYEQERKSRYLTGIALFPPLSLLVLPTSAFSLFPLGFCHLFWLFHKKILSLKKNKELFATYSFSVLLSSFWIFYAYPQWRKAQSNFGESFSSFGAFLSFVGDRVETTLGSFLLLCLCLALILRPLRLLGSVCLFLVFFPLFLAPLLGGGPARVYLVPLPFLFIVASALLFYPQRLQKGSVFSGLVLMLLFLFLGSNFFSGKDNPWESPDWPQIFQKMEAHFPLTDYLIYPANAGFPIAYYFPQDIGIQQTQRLLHRAKHSRFQFIMVGQTKSISASNLQGLEIEIPLLPQTSISQAEINLGGYPVQPISQSRTETLLWVFAFVLPQKQREYRRLEAFFAEHWGILNVWSYKGIYLNQSRERLYSRAYLSTGQKAFSRSALLQMEKENAVQFFEFVGTSSLKVKSLREETR